MEFSIGTFFIYFFVIALCAVVIFVMVILPIILTKQYYKGQGQGQTTNKYIRFKTPFCTFIWEDGIEQGYEGEVDWEANTVGDKRCGVYFDIDYLVTPPEGGYEAYAKSQLGSDKEADLEIEKLVEIMPSLADIRPGKCYHKMEKILNNKERFDTEIREFVADYFWYRQELTKENVSREDLMHGINVSFISVYRNGIIEYSIFEADNIYVDDLSVIVQEDDTKKIQYKAYGT